MEAESLNKHDAEQVAFMAEAVSYTHLRAHET